MALPDVSLGDGVSEGRTDDIPELIRPHVGGVERPGLAPDRRLDLSHLNSSGLGESHQVRETARLLALQETLEIIPGGLWLLTLAARCLSRALDMLVLVPSMAAITLGCTVVYGCSDLRK